MAPTERLVLLALAEWADAGDRTCWRTAAELAGRIGISEEGLRKSIRKLASFGIDPRLPVAFKSDGSPVFAYRGRATTFKLPYLTAAVAPGKAGTAVPPFSSSTPCG
ncbi:helix-turn-helix domain-containing protein [Rhodococcus sp. BH5]|uniref:helix-turn-helix domain-containing protein n=1 Tax=Rhodococcus sp. BH5 TaxID=2871702 RepID=UPI003FA6BC01